MGERSSNFFEEHVEKMVLAVAGLVCIWLLITRVVISPNVIEYGNDKFGPGEIDTYIARQAELLRSKLERRAEPKQVYEPQVDDFVALVDSAIRNIDVSLSLPVPPHISREISDDREYRIPLIGQVSDVEVEHIRAVAYVPTEKIHEENVYEQAEHEPNDIDFVSVEAKFDVAGLYKSFHESFAGENVPQDWRDRRLATPIFAAVQLQRQQLLADGSWSNWQIVPRTRIDHRKRLFEVVEKVEELPRGGMKVRLLQFGDPEIQRELLQPGAYRIASAKEDWLPPSLHKKFVKAQENIDAQKRRERREARAKEKEQRGREREKELSQRRARGKAPPGRLDGGMLGMGIGMGGPGMGGPGTGRRSGRSSGMLVRRKPLRKSRGDRRGEKERPERSRDSAKITVDDIYEEFEKVLITEESDLAKIREPLVFWAHDDTVEPGKSYRYRIRLGVFNPIAGTDQFSEQDKPLKNNAILWSRFSDVTETVEIPGRLYFFPHGVQQAAKAVTVTVCRYALGYWYSEDFTVKQGEVIGKVVESEPVEAEEEQEITVPETIDYATGAVLVDVIPVNDWSGGKNLRARFYFDMLYSFDGNNIERIPIKSMYWPERLQARFNEIKKAEKEPKEPLRAWGGRVARRRRAPRPGEKPGERPGDMEEMMKMLLKGTP